jgi:hypothetical protein
MSWLPEACCTTAVQKEVATTVIKAMVGVKNTDVSPDNHVIFHSQKVTVTVPTLRLYQILVPRHTSRTNKCMGLMFPILKKLRVENEKCLQSHFQLDVYFIAIIDIHSLNTLHSLESSPLKK